ncbi:MAG: hypothetical protein RBJ76_06505 [Stenomitos frigidus ULC029]
MTVTPRCTHLFQTRRDLHHLLSRYKQISEERIQPQIVSLSMAMHAVDPLVVFQALAAPQQLNFYMEKRAFGQELEPQEGVAIAAIGSAAKFTINGAERFTAAQQFIRSTLAHTAICGQAHLPLAGPPFLL